MKHFIVFCVMIAVLTAMAISVEVLPNGRTIIRSQPGFFLRRVGDTNTTSRATCVMLGPGDNVQNWEEFTVQ